MICVSCGIRAPNRSGIEVIAIGDQDWCTWCLRELIRGAVMRPDTNPETRKFVVLRPSRDMGS